MKRLGTALMIVSLVMPAALAWVWALNGMTIGTFVASVVTLLTAFMAGAMIYSKEATNRKR